MDIVMKAPHSDAGGDQLLASDLNDQIDKIVSSQDSQTEIKDKKRRPPKEKFGTNDRPKKRRKLLHSRAES